MDFFDRHKALIITLLFNSVLLLALYNINISNNNQKVRETLIRLQQLQEVPAEEPERVMQKEDQPKTPAQKLRTHQAFNQERDQEDVDSRLEKIFDKNAARQESSTEEEAGESSGEVSLPQKQEEQKTSSIGNDSREKISSPRGSIESSSIEFSLVGRNALEIPNPVYTCDTPGKIVINITVDADGKVISTSVNEASSNSDNECLKTKALQYAKGARFSRLPGRNSQPGTITYHFQD